MELQLGDSIDVEWHQAKASPVSRDAAAVVPGARSTRPPPLLVPRPPPLGQPGRCSRCLPAASASSLLFEDIHIRHGLGPQVWKASVFSGGPAAVLTEPGVCGKQPQLQRSRVYLRAGAELQVCGQNSAPPPLQGIGEASGISVVSTFWEGQQLSASPRRPMTFPK